jgi:hypothetical protein
MQGHQGGAGRIWGIGGSSIGVFNWCEHFSSISFYHNRTIGHRQKVKDETLELDRIRLLGFNQFAGGINKWNDLSGSVERQAISELYDALKKIDIE